MRFRRRLEKLPVAATVGCGLLLLIGIGAIDYSTGPDVSFSIFYLIPISWVAWAVGKKAGLVSSIVGAATWLAADLAWRAPAAWGIPCWNSAVRLGFFSIVSLLLAYLRSARDSVEGVVRSRTASLETEIARHKRTETELGRVARVLRALIDCSQIIVRTTSEGRLLGDICRLIVAQPGYCMAWVGSAEQDDAKSIRPAAYAGDGADYLQTTRLSWGDDERSRGPAGTAIRTGTLCMSRNVKDDPRFGLWREQAIKHGYASGLALPLPVEGHVIGALTIYSREPDAFGDREQSLLVEMAQDLAYGIASLRRLSDRDRAEAELRESEVRLRMVVESSMDAIVAVDEQARIAVFNTSAEQLFGYSAQEAIGAPISLLLRQPTAEAHQGRVEKFLGSGIGQCGHIGRRTERVFRRKDGTAFTGEVAMAGSRSSETRLVVVSIHDITERKRAETALRASEAQLVERQRLLDAFFENALTPLVFLDKDFNFIRVNPAYAKACQRKVEDFPGHNHFEFYPSPLQATFEEVVRTKTPWQIAERPFAFPDHPEWGTTWWDLALVPLLDARGEVETLVFSLHDVTDRKRGEESLRESEQRLALAASGTRIGIYDWNIATGEMAASEQAVAVIGLRPTTTTTTTTLSQHYHYRQWAERVHPEDLPVVEAEMGRCQEQRLPFETEYRVIWPDGSTHWLAVRGVFQYDNQDKPASALGVLMDITERKTLEQQLLQAQKMEAIGRLAGGVAHDFRNQLTVITGFGEMLLRRSLVAEEGKDNVTEILKAAERSVTLTNELLAFSRRQMIRPKVVNLDEMIADMSKSLARMIGEDIRLSVTPSGRDANVSVDPSEFQHAMMNLVTNARDAMPRGGRLTVETANVDLDQAYVRQHPEASIGPHVVVMVSDTGVGMDRQAQEKLFDPFFTTKPVGQGTGLGLSMVYGFVKQAGGHITVDSKAGHGTTFRLYFPRATETVQPLQGPMVPGVIGKGVGTVLVVEDEEAVRRLVVETLKEAGYTVLEAALPGDGLSLAEQYRGKIDLLIADVVMPDMNGPALAERIRALRSGIPVIFISGYASDTLSRHGLAEKDVKLLVKPLDAQVLAQTVQEALGRPDEPGRPG